MRMGEFLERFVFVRKCVGCSELIGYELRDDAFCPVCRSKYEGAKSEPCKICSAAMVECSCMPKRLSKSGLPTLRKLFSYKSAQTSLPQSRMLYFIKHNRNTRVTRFVARQLELRLDSLLRENGLDPKDAIITYIPRTRAAVARYGHDQSELICLELSRESGVEFVPLFCRSGGREQKRLLATQRSANAKGIDIDADASSLVAQRTVILFDDIVTSGASMARAVRLLRAKGVKGILGLCIALTE